MFQILTKRPMTMKRYCAERFGQQKIPNNLWLGTSVEDNRVAGRIDQLVQMKELHGDFVAFLSVEPLIGPVDKHGYRFMDWILIGGESGNGARPCAKAWVEQAIEAAMQADVPIWFKQWGQWKNNPLYHQQPRSTSHLDRVARAIEAGELHASIESEDGKLVVRGEKGGATIDGMDYRDYPEWFYVCRAAMNNSDEKGRLT
jgi:2'-5' RNA ligase